MYKPIYIEQKKELFRFLILYPLTFVPDITITQRGHAKLARPLFPVFMMSCGLVLELVVLNVDFVVLNCTWYVALHAWEVLYSGYGVRLAKVNDDVVWELDALDC